MAEEQDDLTIRSATPDDIDEIVALAGASLGWRPDEPNSELFRWKHLENPFGRSPLWVATHGSTLVGLRTFLRWRFRRPDGVIVSAVRAVDTATHPDFQGRGIFTRLTRHALEELEDVAFVFNTPNDRSRPGYLRMGWRDLGRIPISLRVGHLGAIGRLLRARRPAERWPVPSDLGVDPLEFFADDGGLERLARRRPPAGLVTDTSPAFLRWRYGLPSLGYRCLAAGDRAEDGFLCFRLRRRGPAVEATICAMVVADGRGRAERDLLGVLARGSGADFLVRADGPPVGRDRFVRVPGLGPKVTWRAVRASAPPALPDWHLTLGDLEGL